VNLFTKKISKLNLQYSSRSLALLKKHGLE